MPFQNITPARLALAQLPATVAGILYTVPAGTRTFLKDIDIANTTAAAINARVYLVPSLGAPGDANTLIPFDVPAKSIAQWTGSQILNEGDTIQGLAGSVGLTLFASGGEAT